MNTSRNNTLNVFADIIGRRVGNTNSNVNITQGILNKNAGAFDANVKIRVRKLKTLINERK